MKNFWGWGLRNTPLEACLKKVSAAGAGMYAVLATALVLGVVMAAASARAQGNFANATVLPSDTWGSVTNDNTGVIRDTNCPNIAGFAPNAPLWYSWTAPKSGEVELDTIGSDDPTVVTNLDFGYSVTNVTLDTTLTFNGTGYTYGPPAVTYQTLVTEFNFVAVTNDYPLDTVLAVFTGNSINGLSQVAANDNLFPVNNSSTRANSESASVTQINESDSGDYAVIPGSIPAYVYLPPYYGPSHLRFNAVAGTTYYFAVDSKPNSFYPLLAEEGGYQNVLSIPQILDFPATGNIVLHWAYQSSGVFRFASEDFDWDSGLPLYQTASTESVLPEGTSDDANSTILTYYPYNAPGVLVTVNRVGGAAGRCTIQYSTVDGTNMTCLGQLPPNDVPGVAGVDYTPVSGTLVFDDNEMSKTILVPILGAHSPNGQSFGNDIANVYFGLVLSNAQLDPNEFADVSQPRVDPTFSTAMIKILNQTADPYGPDMFSFVYTNTVIAPTNTVVNGTNMIVTVTNQVAMTNQALALAPTNVLFGFEKANYRVPEDVNNTGPGEDGWTHVAVYVERFGTNGAAATLNYTVNRYEGDDFAGDEEENIFYPLQPGSDYGAPTPPQFAGSVIRGAYSDYNLASGTISFPATGPGSTYQEITFTINNTNLTKFNKDFRIELYRTANVGNTPEPWLSGEVAQTTVTILFNDFNPPAGSVDEFYNADFNNFLAVPSFEVPQTIPSRDPDPGVSGYVKSVLILTNNEALIAGNFVSYNGFQLFNSGNPISSIALVDTNGNLDQSFAPVTGADGTINSIAATASGQYIIGGDFQSYNGLGQNYIARINGDGSLDSSFTPVVDNTIYSVAVQLDGKIVIGGDFSHVNNQAVNCLARLNPDGSLDSTFNPGTILSGTVDAVSLEPTNITSSPEIMVGGSFSVSGQTYANVARFTANGQLDTTFSNSFAGADNTVYALGWQPDGKIVIGGAFDSYNGISDNGIGRLNWDGSLDTANFFIGTGANDIVWNVNIQTNGTIYVGGQFSEINGTHRLGFARLYSNGTVDTTFMDTAYDQFAGLKKIFASDLEAVYTSGVQSDGNIIIGGLFNQVGGGQASTNVCNSMDDQLGIQESFNDPNLWIEPKTRDGFRNRSSVARLIGGSTPGPGNIQMQLSSYSANKSQTSLTVGLVRTNGELGPISANFSITPQLAQAGRDYSYDSTPPLYWVASQFTTHPSRDRSEGLFGLDGSLEDIYGLFLTLADLPLNNQSVATVSVINNTQTSGNINAQFQLSNPGSDGQFYLGGEYIPLGTALGASSAPFTLIDDTSQYGTFGFISTNYIATNNPAVISIVRSNGTFGTVTMRCFATNGTAISGTDYRGVTNFSVQFLPGVVSNAFSVPILNNGLISTNFIQKTISLSIQSLSGGNAMYGISNATLILVNPNFQGYLTLSQTNYVGNENSGSMSFIVNRVSGSAGQISVQYATSDGSAFNGVNYSGSTNSLSWSSGDVSPRVINIPLIDRNLIGNSEQFNVRLFNPTNSAGYAPSLFYTNSSPGSITNATMTITNNDNAGALQFSAPSYLVSANGGYATVTVVRTGGATGSASVNYGTSPGSNTTAGVNYAATNGTLTFAANQISAAFNVQVFNGGTQYSSNFFFNVTLSSPVNAALGSITNAAVSILSTQYNWPPGSTNGLFNASANAAVLALALQTNGNIIAGGDFTSINGTPQDYITRLLPSGSLDSTFAASASGPVQAVVCQTDGNIIIGGSFSTVDGLVRNNIARVMTNGFLDTSFNPGPGAKGAVYSLAETFINGAREIYVGGSFSAISSGPGNNSGSSFDLARLNNNGTLDTSFNIGAGADGAVYSIAVYPTNSIYAGDLLIGGAFIHYNGAVVNGIARLTSSGSLDTTFNAGSAATNGTVYAIVIQPDGRVLVGGSFGTFNGASAGNIVRLNTDGSTDASFTTAIHQGANNTVDAITLQPDDRILVAGQFTQVAGISRNGVTRLLPTGATDPTINFGTGVNGAVNAAVVQASTGIITLGGAFTAFNGRAYNNIVQIYGLSVVGSGAFQFSAGDYQVSETGVVAPITVIRTGGTSGTNSDGTGNISVNFSTVTNGSSAVPNVNYTPVSTTLTFAAGQTMATVNVPILDDIVFTTNSWNLNLALSSPMPPAVLGAQYQAQLNIQNVNTAVSFAAGFPTVFENVFGGVANIDVTRVGATNSVSSVTFYTTTNGTSGIPGTDYFPTNETLTFNPGVSDLSAQVLIISNSTPEKTIGLGLTNPVNTILFAPSNATLTVIDNVSPPGELFFAATNFTVNESAGTVTLTVLRTNGFSGSVSANYMTVDGSAVQGINYQSSTGTVKFNNNDTSENFTIPLLANNPPEGPVSFSVILTGTSGGASLIAPTNTAVTIIDDVNTGVSFLNATNTFSETNTSVTVPVERLGSTNIGFTVSFHTTNGTAIAGVNYVTNSGTLTFAPDQTLVGIPITLINNLDISNVAFGLVLSPPTPSGVALESPSNAVIVINPSAAGIAFTSPTNSVFKNGGSITIPVVCINPAAEPLLVNTSSVPLSVKYATVNGTAQAGVDYGAVSGTLFFTNGIVTNTITVPIQNNSLITGLRTFTVSLSDVTPVPPGKLVNPSNELITIIDSNSGLAFSSPNYSIAGGGLATITVVRVDNTNTVSTVAYSTVAGGSAVPFTDYFPTNGTLTFSNGITAASFNVTVIGQSGLQPNKSVVLELSNPTNGVLTAPNVATLNIISQTGDVVPAGVALGPSNVPANGILQSNQPVTLWFAFRDASSTGVSNVYATLLTSSNVTNPSPATAQSYGSLAGNGPSVSRLFTLTPLGTNSQTFLASFKLQYNANITTTNSFTLTIGSWSTTFSNTNAIIITNAPANGISATAMPYPSLITVSNVGGVLVGATVTLTNFSATSPQAVGVLVVSPGQQDTLLMGSVGSANVGANHVTLTFSDAATNSLPSTTTSQNPITNGVYKPTQDGAIPNFP